MFLHCENGILNEYHGSEEQLVLPDSVMQICPEIFADNRHLRQVTCPEGLEVIGQGAFRNVSQLRIVSLPSTLTEIGREAFCGCGKLSRIQIPKNVTMIGRDAFAETPWYSRQFGKFVIAGDGVLLRYRGHEKSVTVPKKIRHIGGGAFAGCSTLEEVILPEGVDVIGEEAFDGCISLRRVQLPGTLDTLGDRCFADCPGLAEILLPDSLLEIGDEAFSGCTSLADIALPPHLYHLGAGAFAGCSCLSEIVLPDSVQELGEDVFQACTGLQSAVLPAASEELPAGTFRQCTILGQIRLSAETAVIGERAFMDCEKLRSISLPDAVCYLRAEAFRGCTALESIRLPAQLAEIGEDAFRGCTALGQIALPPQTAAIGAGAFADCTALREVTCPPTLHLVAGDAFAGTPWLLGSGQTFHTIGAGLLLRYNGQECRIVIPPEVTQILEDAFQDMQPEEIILHERISRIGMRRIPGLRLTCSRRGESNTIRLGDGEETREENRVLRFWEMQDPEEQQILFESIRAPEFRYPLLLLMARAEPDRVYYRSACKIEAPEITQYCIRTGDSALLGELLAMRCLSPARLDPLIELAIRRAQKTGDTEPQILLTHYKDEAGGFTSLEDLIEDSFTL